MNGDHPPDLLTFPCDFPIKVMGEDADGFSSLVIEIVERHVGALSDAAIASRSSRTGRYLSLTLTFEATSRAQLDDVYRELSAHPRVLMVL